MQVKNVSAEGNLARPSSLAALVKEGVDLLSKTLRVSADLFQAQGQSGITRETRRETVEKSTPEGIERTSTTVTSTKVDRERQAAYVRALASGLNRSVEKLDEGLVQIGGEVLSLKDLEAYEQVAGGFSKGLLTLARLLFRRDSKSDYETGKPEIYNPGTQEPGQALPDGGLRSLLSELDLSNLSDEELGKAIKTILGAGKIKQPNDQPPPEPTGAA